MSEYSSERGNPIGARSRVHLRFDGGALFMSGGATPVSYPAVSGAGGLAPIPPGRYWIRPAEMWARTPLKDFQLDAFGGPGFHHQHRVAWGDHRITIHPYPDTPVGERGGFFIHGGLTPGSAGCIDVTHHMERFVRDLKRELGAHADAYVDLTVYGLPVQP